MGDVKISAEWCEEQAAYYGARRDGGPAPRLEHASAYRLAALALRRHEAMRAERAAYFAVDGVGKSWNEWARCSRDRAAADEALDNYCHEITRPSAAEERVTP